jgi:hypothetical protein
MKNVIEIKEGVRTCDGNVNWANLLAMIIGGMVIGLLLYGAGLILKMAFSNLLFISDATLAGDAVDVFLILAIISIITFLILGLLTQITATHGLVINVAERHIVEWHRSLFLRKSSVIFAFSDFQTINIVSDRVKSRYGYSYGYAIKLVGGEKEIKYGFFQKYSHALPQAKKISTSLNLPMELDPGSGITAGDPLPATIAISVICLIIFSASFFPNHSPASWLWATRIFVIVAFATNLYDYMKHSKRDKMS